jgi:hypothetical protein
MFDPRTGSHVHDFACARPRRPVLHPLTIAAVLAVTGAALLLIAAARAADLGPDRARAHQLVACPPHAACHAVGTPRTSLTACRLDLAGESIVAPRGTRLACVREEKRR